MKIVPISDLLSYHFIIPPYQRGYRWEIEQIEALLEDLKEFADRHYNDDEIFYCLQPISVVPVTPSTNTFEVVDGQQRLTTIYLILHFLANKGFTITPFSLSLPRRRTQDHFLNKAIFADGSDKTYLKNIDNFYLRKAYDTIRDWFAKLEQQRYIFLIADMLVTAASSPKGKKAHVAVIWNEIKDSDALNSFKNLNYGKIPLTSTEIIKALLLQTDCYSNKIDVDAAMRRAGEWERMNLLLSRSSLKGIFGEEDLDMTDVVISFVADEINRSKNYGFFRKAYNEFSVDLFNYYVISRYLTDSTLGKTGISRSDAADEIWKEIQKVVNQIANWTSRRTWYHLIGLYSLLLGKKRDGNGLPFLKKIHALAQGKDKKEFTEELRKAIGHRIVVPEAKDTNGNKLEENRQGLNSPNLNYDDDPQGIIRILTAFNVMTVENNRDSEVRFNFAKFRKYKVTSLEHIHPQNIRDANRKETAEWLTLREKDILRLTEDDFKNYSRNREEILAWSEELKTLLADDTTFNAENVRIRELTDAIDEFFGDMANIKPEELHHIKNMALVDRDTNSALQNYFLDTKRNILIERDRNGDTYLTPATEQVFSKRFSASNPGNMNFWEKDDRKNYLVALQKTYSYFTEKQSAL